ncbi:hypothetical protein PUMCH_002928 [Australozyma saopauloensis]|uniref:Calcipressin n=1 Tax=Australozyma saopauloensis TaxID=291208 RepID=A0AAX4HAQ6_9ASCO|nr:hypothetical protein PUMCH_002928 [[Candida] saopauloensis]
MPRTKTNSLILSDLQGSIASDPQEVAKALADAGFQSELVFLPRFKRYIVICLTKDMSEKAKHFLEQQFEGAAKVSYSLRDNPLLMPFDGTWALKLETTDYLELPLEEGSKRFLILPPLSPQSEWDDYGKTEEGPNKKAIYSPDELAHLLWDRLGGFESTQVRRFEVEEERPEDVLATEKPIFDIAGLEEILFEDIPAGLPAIVVDKVSNRAPQIRRAMPKTAIPPKLD